MFGASASRDPRDYRKETFEDNEPPARFDSAGSGGPRADLNRAARRKIEGHLPPTAA